MKIAIRKLFGGAIKALAAGIVIALVGTAWAEEYNDGTYTWTYQISNGKAEIYKGATEAAIDPKPDGSLEIPSELGGYPVTRIGEGAFYGCTDLWAAEVPDSVTSIGDNAFYGSLYLGRVSLPRRFVNVLTKTSPAFAGCSGLLEVGYREVVDDIVWQFRIDSGEAVLDNDNKPVIPNWTAGHVKIPSKLGGYPVKHIGAYAFAGCASLTGVTIPDSVLDVKMNAFYECTSLKAVTLPDSVTEIGKNAFRDCSALEIVSIPDSVTIMGDNAFEGTALKELHTEPGSAATVEGMISSSGYTASLTTSEDLGVVSTADYGGLTWSYRIVDGTAELYKGAYSSAIPDDTVGAIEIPSELDGHPVTRIGDYAFYYCDDLTEVTIPDGVTSIGAEAFDCCLNMEKVTIPYSVTRIERRAFANCHDLADASIPYSETSIADGAFSGCDALADAYGFVIIRGVLHCYAGSNPYVTVPASVTRIGDYAFYQSSVSSVDIPASVTSIGEGAFAYCHNLADVTIPGSVASIGDYAFYNCDNIYFTEVVIPAGVTSIGGRAFDGCTSLTDVWIPSTVTDIGDNAFYSSSLANVHVASAAEETRVGGLLTASGLSLGGITFHYDASASFTATFDANGGTVSETSRTVAGGDILGVLPTPTLAGFTFHAWFADDTDGRRATASEILTADETFYAHWIPEGYGKYEDADGVEWIYKVNGDEVEIVNYDVYQPAIPVATMGYIEVPEEIEGKPVTRIGDYAFYDCNLLAEVYIPESVTSIGESAFEDCDYLTYMNIPDSVTSIGESAFEDCAMLTDLILSDGLTSIAPYMFSGCSSLQAVSIFDDVTSIGEYAFSGCSSLESVDVPDGLTSIGEGAFQYCTLLEYVYLPGTLMEIGPSAFQGSGLTSVTVPAKVALIDYDTFADCVALETILIPYSVTSIGEGAFSGCGNLDDVEIPGSVTDIADNTFRDCSALTHMEIPASVTTIGEQVFDGCSSLVSISIPKSVTSVGAGAFGGCSSWTTVHVEAGDTDRVKGILEALSYTGKTYEEDLASEFTVTFDPDDGTEKTSLKVSSGATIGTLPEPKRDDCTFIGWFTDDGVQVEESAIATADVTLTAHWIEWQYRIVDGGAELYNDDVAVISTKTAGAIVVPDTLGGVPVTRIGDYAFEDCDALTSVTLPATVKEIGVSAFSYCTSLLAVPLPAGLTRIGKDAFYECSSLSMSVPDGVEVEDGAFYGCVAMKDPDGFVIVGGILHYYAGSDAVVTVPDGVTAIGSSAFEDCDFMTSVTLPDGLTRIGDYAFAYCKSVKMKIPASVTEIGYCAFYRCDAMADPDGFVIVGGILHYYAGSDAVVTVPDGVTAIGSSAFEDCDFMTSVTLPDGLTRIGDYAFAYCKSVKMKIPASVTEIGYCAFYRCDAMADPDGFVIVGGILHYYAGSDAVVTVPDDVTAIGSGAFEGCYFMTSVTLPDGLTRIGDYAFADCTSMNMEIPEAVTSIGADAFYGCTALADAVLPAGLTYLGDRAFAGCMSLASVTVPASLEAIPNHAFASCTSLAEATISDGVTRIGQGAFYKCAIAEIVVPDSVTNIADNAFKDCGSLKKATLPIAFEDSLDLDNVFLGCPSDLEIIYHAIYTVTFDPNGGTITETSRKVDSFTPAIGTLPEPNQRTGYDFDGWYTAKEGGDKIGPTYEVTADMTCYAHWTPKTYTITFNSNGGSAVASITQKYGTAVVAPAAPTRAGFKFTGWSPAVPATMPAENMTCYAQWTEDPGSGSGGEPTIAPATEPVKPFYDVLEMGDIVEAYAAPKALTLSGAVYDDKGAIGIVELKLGKVNKNKKTSKLSGSVTLRNGKKYTMRAETIPVDGVSPAKGYIQVKGLGTLYIAIGGKRFAGSLESKWLGGTYHVQSDKVGGNWGGSSATVRVDADDFSMFPGEVIAICLPYEETAHVTRNKWTFKKATSVKWAKPKNGAARPEVYDEASGKGLTIDVSKGKTNLSGMKLTYTPKKGTFKGTFKVYSLQGTGKKTKLKTYTVNVNGVVVNGVGYGEATCKRPRVTWLLTVK